MLLLLPLKLSIKIRNSSLFFYLKTAIDVLETKYGSGTGTGTGTVTCYKSEPEPET
jgi:hypothetical protein